MGIEPKTHLYMFGSDTATVHIVHIMALAPYTARGSSRERDAWVFAAGFEGGEAPESAIPGARASSAACVKGASTSSGRYRQGRLAKLRSLHAAAVTLTPLGAGPPGPSRQPCCPPGS